MPETHARKFASNEPATPQTHENRGAPRTRAAATSAAPAGVSAPVQRCDFCGAESTTVRRVALDRDYDRLQQPHRELYACGPCSERKEGRRLGLGR